MIRLFSINIRHWIRPMLGCMAIVGAMTLLSSTRVLKPSLAQATDDQPASPSAVQAPSASFPANGATLGAIPDTNLATPACQNNSTTFRDVTFNVSGLSGSIVSVAVDFRASHTYLQDLEVTLTAPSAVANRLLFSATGTTTTVANSCGGSSNDLLTSNVYTFADTAGANWWTTAATNPIPTSTNRTVVSGVGGTTNPPATTTLSSAFAGLSAAQANGAWTLRFRDRGAGDTGTVTAANLTITTDTTGRAPLDFDGDGKTDYALTRDLGGTIAWYLQRSSLGFSAISWGATADVFVPGDYDGDGKWDVAVWRPGTPGAFYIFRSSSGTLQSLAFGQPGDDPRITQDFDGDGKADPAVTRNVAGTLNWYIQRSTLGFTAIAFGDGVHDVSVRGDYDGDGKADVAVYRTVFGVPANTFVVMRSSDAGISVQNWGLFSSDYVVPGDYDGDGKTDYAVWRGTSGAGNGAWYWIESSSSAVRSLAFGVTGVDRPTPVHYDGDGKTDQAVWRPGTPANFYVNRSTAGFAAFTFGLPGDSPPAFTLQAR